MERLVIGPLILVIGLLGLWALTKGKAGPVIDAITGNSGFSTSLNNALGNLNVSAPSSGSSSSGNVTHSTNNATPDSGSHSALVNGVIVTIDKTYAQMTDAEKGAANAYAKQIGNVPK